MSADDKLVDRLVQDIRGADNAIEAECVLASALEASEAKIAALTAACESAERERDEYYKGLLSERNRRKRKAEKIAALAAENATLREKVERAAEDERDRLYELVNAEAEVLHYHASKETRRWLSQAGAMMPWKRAALRQEGKP